MRSARSLGQALAVALQIVALLVFVMPGAAHAHPGAARMQAHALAHATHAAAEPGAHHAAPSATAVSDGCAAQGDPRHAACPDCSCGCHAAFAATETAVSVRRPPDSVRPAASDRTVASLTPEALPEPPRPFA